jgi:hypothetical protein
MPFPVALRDILPADYFALLEAAAASNDYGLVQARLDLAVAEDRWMTPYGGEPNTMYYKPFVQTVVPRIIPALRDAGRTNTFPEIAVTLPELNAKRHELGFLPFGSPQDVLYAFTSERYKDWGATLNAMFFRSACMTGESGIRLSMAPRMLEVGEPDIVVEELSGAISEEFFESASIIFQELCFSERYSGLIQFLRAAQPTLQNLIAPESQPLDVIEAINGQLDGINALPIAADFNKQILKSALQSVLSLTGDEARKTAAKNLLRERTKKKLSQEQIALKFVTEGNYLQKMLNGRKVEHIQSNVKMVVNLLRGNKCEVDSIYRVVGYKKILLLEAKAKNHISKTQLYSVYETFRGRLPLDWDLQFVAVLLSKPTAVQKAKNIGTVLDLLAVDFPAAPTNTVTESFLLMKPSKHIRWLIRKQ